MHLKFTSPWLRAQTSDTPPDPVYGADPGPPRPPVDRAILAATGWKLTAVSIMPVPDGLSRRRFAKIAAGGLSLFRQAAKGAVDPAVRLIFDTDIMGDVDDVGAVARGPCRIASASVSLRGGGFQPSANLCEPVPSGEGPGDPQDADWRHAA